MPDNDLIYPNEYQPRRPTYNENNKPLGFRTHISSPGARYDLFDLDNIICQMLLYRWVKTEFVNCASAADLHNYLFWRHPMISKRRVGCTILQAVAYDPRKLIGKKKTNPKACMVYAFLDPRDLEYGLEWMICIWLRRVVLADDKKAMEAALKELVDAKDNELMGLFWDPVQEPIVRDSFTEFDWFKLWKQFDLKLQFHRKCNLGDS